MAPGLSKKRGRAKPAEAPRTGRHLPLEPAEVVLPQAVQPPTANSDVHDAVEALAGLGNACGGAATPRGAPAPPEQVPELEYDAAGHEEEGESDVQEVSEQAAANNCNGSGTTGDTKVKQTHARLLAVVSQAVDQRYPEQIAIHGKKGAAQKELAARLALDKENFPTGAPSHQTVVGWLDRAVAQRRADVGKNVDKDHTGAGDEDDYVKKEAGRKHVSFNEPIDIMLDKYLLMEAAVRHLPPAVDVCRVCMQCAAMGLNHYFFGCAGEGGQGEGSEGEECWQHRS